MPERPSKIVPQRSPIHVLFGALTELFDVLGMVTRSLSSSSSLSQSVLGKNFGSEMTYAEVSVLTSCRSRLDMWSPRWLAEVQSEQQSIC
jgi:hypothetical protein